MNNACQKILPLSLLTLCLGMPAFGALSSVITVDTASQAGNYGYLELQFNPSSVTTEQAYADIANFMTDGILNPGDTTNNSFTGDITGRLAATVSLGNDGPGADYFEGFTFGNTLSLTAVIAGCRADVNKIEELVKRGEMRPVLASQADASFNPLFVNGGPAAFAVNINPTVANGVLHDRSQGMRGSTDVSFARATIELMTPLAMLLSLPHRSGKPRLPRTGLTTSFLFSLPIRPGLKWSSHP